MATESELEIETGQKRDQATMALTVAIWESICETDVPRGTLETLGECVVNRRAWGNLPGKLKLALIRITMRLEKKMEPDAPEESPGLTEKELETTNGALPVQEREESADPSPVATRKPDGCDFMFPGGEGGKDVPCRRQRGHKGAHKATV